MRNGKNLIAKIPEERWAWAKNNKKWENCFNAYGGFINDIDKFDPMFFHIAPKDAKNVNPQERIMLKVIWELLEDAGYTRESLNAKGSTGLFIGSMYDHYPIDDHKGNVGYSGGRRWETVNRCSFFYDFKGPSIAVDCACSTSLAAVHLAAQSILSGDCDQAVVGAVNLSLHPIKYSDLDSLNMLEHDSHSHSLCSGNGYIPCEGAGAVLLKPYAQAIKDNDNIYAVIDATAVNHGGVTEGFTIPGRAAEKELILKALRKCNRELSDIDYCEVSSTGCQIGDQIEIDVLSELFNKYKDKKRLVGSVKTNLGHLEAASGMSQLTKTLLQLKYSKLFANINTDGFYNKKLNDSGLMIQETTVDWDLDRKNGVTLIDSFGAGGSNAVCVLSKAPNLYEEKCVKDEYLMMFSSYKNEALKDVVQKTVLYLNKVTSDAEYARANHFNLANMEYTLKTGREQMCKRLAVKCSRVDELIFKLSEYCNGCYDNVYYFDLTEDECLEAGIAEPCDRSTDELIRLWGKGADVKWKMPSFKKLRKISLPGLCFIEKSYWNESIESFVPDNSEQLDQLEKTDPEVTNVTDNIDLKNIIKEVLAKIIGVEKDEISDKIKLNDMGINSVMLVEFASELTKALKTDINPIILYDKNNVDKIYDYLKRNISNENIRPNTMNIIEKETSVEDNKIAIIGMSGRFPMAENIDEFWNNLKSGKDCIIDVPDYKWEHSRIYSENDIERNKSYCKTGGFISNSSAFDNEFFGITKTEAECMDPQQKILLEEVWHAFEDSGLTMKDLSGKKCGVFVGAGCGDYVYTGSMDTENLNAFSITGSNPSLIAGRIAYFFNLKGPAVTFDTACSSSLTALHMAINCIENEDCDMAVVAGVNIINTPMLYIMGAQGEMLSRKGRCMAFSDDADGFIPGEGVGVIIIKKLKKAEADKNRVYALISGTSINEDGATNGITAPSIESQMELEYSLYKKLNLDPSDIGYVEAHGTGTKLGDPIEVKALSDTFRRFTSKKQFCAIGSVKSNIGHCLYSAGIAGIIKAVLCLYYKKLVPTINVDKENKLINFEESPFYINKKEKFWECNGKRIATVSSFGFSGNNVHAVIEEYDAPTRKKSSEGEFNIFVFSAKNKESLKAVLSNTVDFLSKNNDTVSANDIAYTLNTKRTFFNERAAFVADSIEKLIQSIKLYLEGEIVISADSKLESVKERFINGELLKFDDLYTTDDRNIISLPGYCFYHSESKKTDDVIDGVKDERRMIENYIRSVFYDVIGEQVSKMPSNEIFSQDYFNSLTIRELINVFSERFGKLSVSLLYEYTTIDQLVSYFINKQSSLKEDNDITENKIVDDICGETLLVKKTFVENELENSNELRDNVKTLVIGASEKVGNIISDILGRNYVSLYDENDDAVVKQLYDEVGDDRRILYFINEEKNIEKTIKKVFLLLKQISEYSKLKRTRLICVYNSNAENLPYLRALSGLLKTFCSENDHISASLIEAGKEDIYFGNSELDTNILVEMLMKEKCDHFEIKYKHNKRYIAVMKENIEEKDNFSRLRKDGTYIITGFNGGIGKNLIRVLADEPLRNLILVGRSAPSSEIKEIEKEYEANLDYFKTDLCNEEEVVSLMDHVKKEYGRLNGIFHLAGVQNDHLFKEVDWEMFKDSISVKVSGTVLLKKYSGIFDMDFMVLFSSVAGAFGNIGQCSYSYANAFLSAYAECSDSGNIISIQWPYWQDGGMKITESQKKYFYKENGSLPLDTESGMELLFRLLDIRKKSITVLHGDIKKLITCMKHPYYESESKNESVKEEVDDEMDIAIIGMDGRYPLANNLNELWDNLKNGRDCITVIPNERWDNERFYSTDKNNENKYYCKYGGFISDINKFDSLFFGISPKDAVYTNPHQRIMLETVWHVMEDAGYTPKKLQDKNVGVYMGVTNSDYKFIGFNRGLDEIKPISDPYASVANMISYEFDFKGPSVAVDTMCSSSLTAIYMACQGIVNGECEVAIVGGANVCMHPQKYLTLCKAKMLSEDGRCKSFGKDANGYVPGEGIGAVMLKPLAKAVQDNDYIYGVIKSCCINHGGHVSGYTVPNPNAQAQLISDAIKKSGIDANTITYIETHGTGTSLGDPIEITGLKKAFDEYTDKKGFCSIGSIKSNIGHLEAAAGIASLTKVLLQMQHKQLVPSLYSKETNKDIDFGTTPFWVQQVNEEWNPSVTLKNGKKYDIPRRAGISSFGAGGTNVHMIVEDFENKPLNVYKETEKNQAILISAKSQESLVQMVKKFIDYLDNTENSLNDIAYSLQTTRESMKKRLAIVASDKAELRFKLRAYLNKESDKDTYSGNITLHYLNNNKVDYRLLDEAVKNCDMRKLAEMWVKGVEVDWENLYDVRYVNRVKLPFYCFKPDVNIFEDYSISGNGAHTEMQKDELEMFLDKYQNNEIDDKTIRYLIGE